MNPVPEGREKWALLIGINQYPNFDPSRDLKGCVNDVKAMRQVLVDSFKFPEDHITLLTNEQATRAGILEAMEDLIARAEEDDVVVFHYSGHGSQVRDREGDEPDGWDETIVPHDSGHEPHPNLDITDDEIYVRLHRLTRKTANVTLVFDCCHSGSITRDSFATGVRGIEADQRLLAELPPSPIPPETRALLKDKRDPGASGWLPLGQRYVLFAGCRPKEQSFEVRNLTSGEYHGALTFHLIHELRAVRPGATCRDVFEAVAPRVTNLVPDQHPQLEGARDLEVFGTRLIEPMAFLPVVDRTGDRVTLGTGSACGLTLESQWEIYPSATKTVNSGEKRLGLIELTRVRALTSEGRVVEELTPEAIRANTRAVELSHHHPTACMPVFWDRSGPRGDDVLALEKGIQSSRYLQLAQSEEDAEVRIYLVPPRQHVFPGSLVPTLGPLQEETWAAVGKNGRLLMPRHRRAEPDAAALMVGNLEKHARRRWVMSLGNQSSSLMGKLEVRLLRHEPGGSPEAPETGRDGAPVFHEGDYLALEVLHEHHKPLHIYILDFGLSGRIEMVYPVSGTYDPLAPGVPHRIWTREGEEVSLFIPKEYPFDRTELEGEADEGIETLKIFATTHPTDFLPLFQPPYRGVERSAREGMTGSLNELIAANFEGVSYREFCRSQSDGPQDWIAIERSFRLRRRQEAHSAAGGWGA